MAQPALLINCDLGEEIPEESLILPWIDVASVACGGHYGDRNSIYSTLSLVKKIGKKAGAHPSYPDRVNFGRQTMKLTSLELVNSIRAQILLFKEVAEELQIAVDHIKFHGALYNDAASNPDLALVLVTFLKTEFHTVPLFVPPHSVIELLAQDHGLPIRREVFGDRSYEKDYRLSHRSTAHALLTQAEQVIPQVTGILENGILRARTGEYLPVNAETICFHGDNPSILDFLPLLRKKFWK